MSAQSNHILQLKTPPLQPVQEVSEEEDPYFGVWDLSPGEDLNVMAGKKGGKAWKAGDFVTKLNPNDVLSGRGSGPNDHTGNIRFRELVAQRKEEYLATSTRQTKARIAQEIVDDVELHAEPPGRFLKKVDAKTARNAGFVGGTEVWTVVDDDTALEKAKQALRQNRGDKFVAAGKSKSPDLSASTPPRTTITTAKAESQSLGLGDSSSSFSVPSIGSLNSLLHHSEHSELTVPTSGHTRNIYALSQSSLGVGSDVENVGPMFVPSNSTPEDESEVAILQALALAQAQQSQEQTVQSQEVANILNSDVATERKQPPFLPSVPPAASPYDDTPVTTNQSIGKEIKNFPQPPLSEGTRGREGGLPGSTEKVAIDVDGENISSLLQQYGIPSKRYSITHSNQSISISDLEAFESTKSSKRFGIDASFRSQLDDDEDQFQPSGVALAEGVARGEGGEAQRYPLRGQVHTGPRQYFRKHNTSLTVADLDAVVEEDRKLSASEANEPDSMPDSIPDSIGSSAIMGTGSANAAPLETSSVAASLRMSSGTLKYMNLFDGSKESLQQQQQQPNQRQQPSAQQPVTQVTVELPADGIGSGRSPPPPEWMRKTSSGTKTASTGLFSNSAVSDMSISISELSLEMTSNKRNPSAGLHGGPVPATIDEGLPKGNFMKELSRVNPSGSLMGSSGGFTFDDPRPIGQMKEQPGDLGALEKSEKRILQSAMIGGTTFNSSGSSASKMSVMLSGSEKTLDASTDAMTSKASLTNALSRGSSRGSSKASSKDLFKGS